MNSRLATSIYSIPLYIMYYNLHKKAFIMFALTILSSRDTTIGSLSMTVKCVAISRLELPSSWKNSSVMHKRRGKCRSSSPPTTWRSSKMLEGWGISKFEFYREGKPLQWCGQCGSVVAQLWIHPNDRMGSTLDKNYMSFFLLSLLTWMTPNFCISCGRFPFNESQVLMNYIRTQSAQTQGEKRQLGL